MPLTDKQIRATKSPDRRQRFSDGAGLCLEVNPNGSKLWRFT